MHRTGGNPATPRSSRERSSRLPVSRRRFTAGADVTTTSSIFTCRGLESRLTRGRITEALTHLGFYAGWSRATKAMTAVTTTLGK
jgi:hypothetical protein